MFPSQDDVWLGRRGNRRGGVFMILLTLSLVVMGLEGCLRSLGDLLWHML